MCLTLDWDDGTLVYGLLMSTKTGNLIIRKNIILFKFFVLIYPRRFYNVSNSCLRKQWQRNTL